MNRFFKLIKSIWDKPDIYWGDLNNYENNTLKEIEAKKEIKELLNPICFILSSFILIYIVVKAENIVNSSGSAFIFFFWALIFTVWVFAVLHTNNSHKHLTPHNPKENLQQLHG